MSSKEESHVHNVTVGPVVIDILRGATNDSHTYLYFQVSRAWQPAHGKKVNLSRFYDRNEKDLLKAVQEASAWIRKNLQAADEGWQPEVAPLAA